MPRLGTQSPGVGHGGRAVGSASVPYRDGFSPGLDRQRVAHSCGFRWGGSGTEPADLSDRRSEGRAADSVEVVGDRFVLARDTVLVADGRSRGGMTEAVHHGPEGSAAGGGES